ncbi:Trifunctional nucleotide phosphoesterase protein YfkN precursor [Microbacterium azadirachtae]|uniref:Trifunctional nucleotide phosphoesterase protein YfkN n=2 Tax=Microbacterium azadirachtae TaxID=582680 RepID=A0A0F0LTP4_9MICO|nr:Trifunctional nucleotide phosphoesterase protein YfkN precursor [Microbacterium azadirachtae]
MKRMRRRIHGVLVIGLTVLLGLGAGGALASPAYAASGFTGTVSIAHLNDVHGNVFETATEIGYARIGGYVDQLRTDNPNTLFLDAGDTFSGSKYTAIDRGASIVPIVNTLGIDAMAAGNHEFSYGSPYLQELASRLDHPMLAGNIVYSATGQPVLPGYAIVTLPNGMKAGVIGISAPASATMGSQDVGYRDAIATTQALVDEVTGQGVDLVIGLMHLGDQDPTMTSLKVADAVTGMNLIVDGHSHTALPQGRLQNGTLIVQTGEFGRNLGVVDLSIVDGMVTSAAARLVSRAAMADVPEKPETKAAVEAFRTVSDAYFAVPIGSTSVLLEGTRDIVRTQETALGNMFADAITAATGTEITLLPAGYVGGRMEPGPITRGDVLTLSRAPTSVTKKVFTGAELLRLLNSLYASFPTSSGSFAQVSGLSVVLDPNGTTSKVHRAQVAGKPLDPDASYTVVTTTGVASGFEGTVLAEYPGVTEMLSDYIVAQSPVAPVIEGRITRKAAGEPTEPGGPGAPSSSPSPVPSSSPTTNQTPAPASGGSMGSGGDPAASGRLAATGAEGPWLVSLLAGGGVLAGLLLLEAARRRRKDIGTR